MGEKLFRDFPKKQWSALPCGCEVKYNGMKDEEILFDSKPVCENHKNNPELLQKEFTQVMEAGMSRYDYDADITDGDCPICLNWIPSNSKRGENMGATSRFDGETEVCSMCGQTEGLIHGKLVEQDNMPVEWSHWVLLINAVNNIDEVRI